MRAVILSSPRPVLAGPGTCLRTAGPREKPRLAEARRRKESFKKAVLFCPSGEPGKAKGAADKTPHRERRAIRTTRMPKNTPLP
jgi:hypothetical protein